MLFRFLCSLKLAVVVILLLALGCTAATLLESYYDTRTAQYWVYQAFWFHFVLFMLGVNIFCVAMSRYPWKRRHTPFLLAHAGIILLLVGSWVTQKFGLDGSLPIAEGEVNSRVQLQQPILYVTHDGNVDPIQVDWVPPHVSFSPLKLEKYGIQVKRFLTHAEPVVKFTPEKEKGVGRPAVKVQLSGGPIVDPVQLWLWTGEPAWATRKMGPAQFTFLPDDITFDDLKNFSVGTRIDFKKNEKGDLLYIARSRSGNQVKGRLASDQIEGAEFYPGWMKAASPDGKGLKIKILEWLPSAENDTQYVRSKIQYGARAPQSAIWVELLNREGVEGSGGIWLGLGDRAELNANGKTLDLIYSNQNVVLPFSLQLDRFTIEHYQGTRNPSSFHSTVFVVENGKEKQGPIKISMNEPLKWGGITFYQSSYIPAEPRPTTSVFSVNQDPGRFLKYFGSILLVLGSTLLFMVKYYNIKWLKS